MELAAKTNAIRILEGLGIQFEVREYEFDPEDLAAETVAAKIGLPPEQTFKTLIVRGDRNTGLVTVSNDVIIRVTGGDSFLAFDNLSAKNLDIQSSGAQNSSCMPICPVQAKYSALKTIHSISRRPTVRIETQSVASRLHIDPATQRITATTAGRGR